MYTDFTAGNTDSFGGGVTQDRGREMEALGDNAIKILRGIVDRVERLENQRDELAADIAEIYVEAKHAGLNRKLVRALIRERRKDPAQMEREAAELDLYRAALGDYASTPLARAMEPQA